MNLPRKASPASYRTRLFAGLAIVVAVLTGAWAWSLWGPFTDVFTAQQEERLAGIARTAAVSLAATAAPLGEYVDEVSQATTLRVTVISEDGTVLDDSEEDPSAMENHGDRPEVAAALAGETGIDIRQSETQGIERVYVAVPATYADTRVVVRVSEPLSDVAALTSGARRTGLIALLIAALAAVAAAWRLTQSTANPIERLVSSARSMADGDLGTPVPETPGALAPLSEALGTLRDELRDRIGALEAEEQTLRLVLDGLADAVFLLDGGRIRMANRALAVMFRLRPGDLTGRELADVGLPASVVAAIASRLDSNQASSADLGPDPFLRYHRVTVVPLGTSGEDAGTLVAVSDLTERMRLDAVRRDFVANASHELKTPVAAILLLAESAESAAEDGDAGQAAAFVSQLSDEAARLRRLVTDLLDLSRIESVPGADEVTDVRRAIDLALSGHQRAASTKGLALASDLTAVAGEDVAVRADPTDVAIALDNLLANAVTYTERGSVVVRVSADRDTVSIDVADTGIGIPAENVDRVFERFYRVDRARSRTSGGTGLGLALVRNVAEKAGGTATIVSEQGVGTTATIRLPRAR